ncbi:MAG TPA: hypothetical protein VGK90_03030 [Rhizomicrobium sp.]
MSNKPDVMETNKARVQTSFERWRAGTGIPFELMTDSAVWTIVGSASLSETCPDKQAFLDEVWDGKVVSAWPFSIPENSTNSGIASHRPERSS